MSRRFAGSRPTRLLAGPAGAALALLLLTLAPARLIAQTDSVTYVQGGVDLEPAGQPRAAALIGDSMNPGDSIITAQDGLAQLQKENLSEITVSPNTVFTLRQIDQNGKKRNVLAVAVGSLAFKFNELGGTEPLIATMSATAGIRGTVLKVFAGADGTSLFVVEAGKVVVTGAQGKSVNLTQNEGVEVSPGLPPGKKLKILRGQVDYSKWNAARLTSLLADPAAAAKNVQQQMSSYIAQVNDLWAKYQTAYAKLTSERAKLDQIQKQKGQKARTEYYAKTVYPLEHYANTLFVNVRYYSLSALSLRRYVLGSMYVRLTSRYVVDEGNPVYQRFLEIYRRTVAEFEHSVVPHLVAADI